MALVAYQRLRVLWGALDWQAGTDNPYPAAQTQVGGPSAVAGVGIGIRRCIATITRFDQHAGADIAEYHHDFVNYTGGNVDDTWITSDYTTLEGMLDTWFTTTKAWLPPGYKLVSYTWYRIGPGVTKPNPFERQLIKTTPIAGTGTGHPHAPQVASTITFRTAVRRSWGRTYFPMCAVGITTTGNLTTAVCDQLCTASHTLLTSAAAADFQQVVYSPRLSAALGIEKVEVDDVFDIVRRRRWKSSTYKKLLP